MKEIEIVDDPDKIKIIIEETRAKILRLLRFRDMTISEMSSILNKDVSTIFRHVKKLENAGLIRVTGERKIHNVPEKLYGRVAKTIILAPESFERSSMIRRFEEKRTINVKRALEEMGYEVGDENFLKKFMIYIEDLPIEDLNKLSKDMDWNDLRVLQHILILLKIDVDRVKDLRKKIYKPIT